ncbi:amidohydrolase family protein [Pseudonocardia sp. H11422]|uniref:amidohydrolase family protein n=1 Tax=Pseudonocardia sp. H11422 TaxID=2835866 RepID=UPI001BDDAFA5|nr:amidohydrolase family protein [Pseudonocardia sp. H11422]
MPVETAVAAASLLSGRTRRPGVHLCLAHGGGALPAVLPRSDRAQILAGRAEAAGHRMLGERARELWCDSLTYDADSLRLTVERFGRDHVLLGTDYPFAAREFPPGVVLDDLDEHLRAAISRDNLCSIVAGRRHRSATRPATG